MLELSDGTVVEECGVWKKKKRVSGSAEGVFIGALGRVRIASRPRAFHNQCLGDWDEECTVATRTKIAVA